MHYHQVAGRRRHRPGGDHLKPSRQRSRSVGAALALAISAAAFTLMVPGRAYAYPGYRSYSTSAASVVYFVVISVILTGLAVFGMTTYGRQFFRRGGSLDPWDPRRGVMPGSLTASTPLTKAKGMYDCPQCGLPVQPGTKQCPQCHWNFHSFQVRAPVTGDGTDPADLAGAGFAAVAVNPLSAAEELSTAAGDLPALSPPGELPGPGGGGPAGRAGAIPAAPGEPVRVAVGVVQRDIIIDGTLAFRRGERVAVESQSPDPGRPEYKYVVTSQALNRKFRLSDMDLFT